MSNEIMTMPQQQNSLGYVDPAAIASAEGAKAQIQAAYIMAYQKPRSYDLARVRIIESCKRPTFATKVQYQKPIGGGKHVSGGSIRFAEMLCREWGNILVRDAVIYDDATTRRITVTAVDLETNATLSKDIQLTKSVERSYANDREVLGERTNSAGKKTFIVRATEDEMQIKQEAAVSKAKRNLIIALIPQEITEEAIEVADQTMSNHDAANPGEARKKLVDGFYSIGVLPTDLENYLEHPIAAISPAELKNLRSIFVAIRDGDAKWNDYVKKDEPATYTSKEEAKAVTEKVVSMPDPKPPVPAQATVVDDSSPMVKEESGETKDLRDHVDLLMGPDFLGLSLPHRMKVAQTASNQRTKEISELNESELSVALVLLNKEVEKRGIGA